MDGGYDRSPVDRRDDYRGSRRRESPPPSGPAAGRGRSRSRSPPRRGPASGAGDRFRRGPPGGDRRRSRSRSPPRRRYDSDPYPHSSTRGGYVSRGGYRGGSGRDAPAPRSANREYAAQEAIKTSKKENRVYIGNLAFSVKWHDLKDFCSTIGNVVFAEIIQLPTGMSKGCGIVEFSTREEALRAITELNERQLMGRPVYLREDREDDARYGSAAVSSRTSFPGASYVASTHPSASRNPPPIPAAFAPPGPRGLFISGMSPNINWQDLKDLFRAAGEVVRADINLDHTTGISKGTGVVVMSSKSEMDAAIAMFNGYEFDGGRLDVREDRFFHINQARNARGGMGRGGARGGGFVGRAGPPGRYGEDSYNDYGSSSRGAGGGGYGYSDLGPRGPRAGRPPVGPDSHMPFEAPASTQIFVKNLPWSTSNEDLVELFQTTGTVQEAEVIWENGRSKGAGVVQFASIEEAETAIAKFQNYEYGGRPIGIAFNGRWKDFTGGGPSSGRHADENYETNGHSRGQDIAGEISTGEELPVEDVATEGMQHDAATEGMEEAV